MSLPTDHSVARRRDLKQVAIFGTISVVTTVLDFVVFNVLVFFDLLEPVLANTVSYGTGILASYGLNKNVTFAGRGRDRWTHELGLFVLFNLAALALNNVFVFGASRVADESPIVLNGAKLVAGALTWVFKFATFRRWVYPARRPDPGSTP